MHEKMLTKVHEQPLTVSAKFCSDWIIGTGYGRGKEVDAATIKDARGFPFLPAKSVIGVLRENATDLARSLDGAPEKTDAGGNYSGTWSQWVDYVFGTQVVIRQTSSNTTENGSPLSNAEIAPSPVRTAALKGRPLMIGIGNWAKALGVTDKELAEAMTVVRSGIKIDEQTGTTVPDFLRFEERARAGFTLRGIWEIGLGADDDFWPAVFLVRAASQMTLALGGKRSRGAGEVLLSIVGESAAWNMDIKELAERVAASTEIPAPPTVEDSTGSDSLGSVDSADEAADARRLVHVFDLKITAESKLILGGERTGNITRSGKFVPGAMLLPIVLKAIPEAGSALRNGSLVVTDGLPSVGENRSVPWPLALTRRKDAANRTFTNKFSPYKFDSKLKPSSGWLVPADGGQWQELKVTAIQSTHSSIANGKNGDPELFIYEAVEAGTSFIAQVWLPAELAAQGKASSSLPTTARLGQSKKDDFGAVSLDWKRCEDSDAETDRVGIAAGEPIRVHLTSDVLLRGNKGSQDPTAEALLDELGQRLRTTFALADSVDLKNASAQASSERAGMDLLSVEPLIVKTTSRDSWQVKWGLPRPTLQAICGGSVLQLVSSDEISAAQVTALENSGIGERTAEGFGRVVFNPPYLQSSYLDIESSTASIRDEDSAVDGADDNRALVWKSLFQRRIELAVVDVAEGLWEGMDGEPGFGTELSKLSRSQLGILRGLVNGLSSKAGIGRFDAWRESVFEKDKSTEAMKRVADGLRSFINKAEISGSNPSTSSEYTGRAMWEVYEAQSKIEFLSLIGTDDGVSTPINIKAAPYRSYFEELKVIALQSPMLQAIDWARKGTKGATGTKETL